MPTPGRSDGGDGPACRRCGVRVVAGAEQYEVFEGMHYVCFHDEFEHTGDPDVECSAGGCPASGAAVPAAWVRVSGVDLAHTAETFVPAVLALEASGYVVTQEVGGFVARLGGSRFTAADPVALLGLVRLAESRRPWRADAAEIADVTGRLRL